MGKSFSSIKGRTSNKKAAGQKKIRPRVVTAVTTRSIRVSKMFQFEEVFEKFSKQGQP